MLLGDHSLTLNNKDLILPKEYYQRKFGRLCFRSHRIRLTHNHTVKSASRQLRRSFVQSPCSNCSTKPRGPLTTTTCISNEIQSLHVHPSMPWRSGQVDSRM